MKTLQLLIALLLMPLFASAQKSEGALIFVNGEQMAPEEFAKIDPDDVLNFEVLPADEQTIERYGQEASNGVILVELHYDEEARFVVDDVEKSFSDYIASQVKWGEAESVAQVVISFTVDARGKVCDFDTLSSSDRRLERRVVKAMEEAPLWIPATKDGKGVARRKLLKVTLPEGGQIPRERVVLIR
jgi:hypothetical protein